MPPSPPDIRAFLDIRKLEDYCLDTSHPRGRHKARVFREALDIGREHAPWLREILLRAVHQGDATKLLRDRFGSRWSLDVTIQRQTRTAVVRTIWIERTGEDVLRFVTCWVL